jgi:photosystem II stability/assembly factor-like uncharacterized protein
MAKARRILVAAAGALVAAAVSGAAVSPDLFSDLRWRLVGPFRGGRVLAVAGVAGDPATFYFGSVGGGLWKTTDGGRVWFPIFDAESVASIGAVAVAPSSPDVIYAGTGEADMRSDISFGNGVYRSDDAGKTWIRAGLSDTRHIARILVDPADPDVVLVAALGHAYAANEERGVFRSEDGGRSWKRTLYLNTGTGAADLAFDPTDPSVVYASMWQVRRPAWSTYAPISGPRGGLYKSADGGRTWRPVAGKGLPAGVPGRFGLAAAPAGRVYAVFGPDEKETGIGGLYRSDDGGATWSRTCADPRIWGRGWYFGSVTVDPRDPDTVYVPNVALYRSTDGGVSFTAVKGAPGGDDYHALWIDPGEPRRMIAGSDQGATVSIDGAATWSSWYNQPTAQIYHVAVDRRFPYRIYGSQQDSGTVAIASRGDSGRITACDAQTAGGEESGYLLPDPADPDVVYGGGPGGTLLRFDRKTGQSQTVSPWPERSWRVALPKLDYRFTWTSPLAFSPQEPGVLYMGSQFVLESRDAGHSWRKISPDLSRTGQAPAGTVGRGYGVVYSIAPSPRQAGVIWAGTDDGKIALTRDGGHTWADVTPPGLSLWSKVAVLEASPHDAATAYAAIDRHRLDDFAPHLFRTRDYGMTWTSIVAGLSAPAFVRAVREDPVREGLLFAATETGVAVSFDDGDHWQPLRLNLPPASVRDLAVAGADLVAATHGRSFWVLDDIEPLRELAAGIPNGGHLFRPEPAVRVRASLANDTPLPPEEPTGENPPAGAVLDYVFDGAPTGEVRLEIRDSKGELVRAYSSREAPRKEFPPPPFSEFWLAAPARLPKKAGHNRFVWDLRYPSPPLFEPGYGLSAVPGATPANPQGPLVLPGTYQVRLTAEGKSWSAPLVITMDPRVRVAREDLARQLDLAGRICRELAPAVELARKTKAAAAGNADGAETRVSNLASEASEIAGGLAGLLTEVDRADAAPTDSQWKVFERYRARLAAATARR